MSTGNKNSNQRSGNTQAPEKLEAPWYIHVYVWIFMITLGLSPLLHILQTTTSASSSEVWGALVFIPVIQGLLWIAQQRCSSEDLSYWEGLLVASASMRTGFAPLSLLLSFFILLFTVAASIVFALTPDRARPVRQAWIRFSRLIIAIHRRRLRR